MIALPARELRIETFRGSGVGNVRVTHLASGIVSRVWTWGKREGCSSEAEARRSALLEVQQWLAARREHQGERDAAHD